MGKPFEDVCILRSGGDNFGKLLILFSLRLFSQLEVAATKVELLLLLHGDVATTVGWLSKKRQIFRDRKTTPCLTEC